MILVLSISTPGNLSCPSLLFPHVGTGCYPWIFRTGVSWAMALVMLFRRGILLQRVAFLRDPNPLVPGNQVLSGCDRLEPCIRPLEVWVQNLGYN